MQIKMWTPILMLMVGCGTEPIHDISSVSEGTVMECKDIGDGYFAIRIKVQASRREQLVISERRLQKDDVVTVRQGHLEECLNGATAIRQPYCIILGKKEMQAEKTE